MPVLPVPFCSLPTRKGRKVECPIIVFPHYRVPRHRSIPKVFANFATTKSGIYFGTITENGALDSAST